tara:strand:+ start:3355 stop:4167 length:813 start_codon:yes stop_codon:yes gene_type:complete
MTELKLKRFNMENMKSDSIVLLLAKRRTGKSFLCRDIMHNHKDIPSGIIISPTEKANTYYGNFVPDLYIYNDYTPELIQGFLKRQQHVRDIAKTRKGIDERSFLVMDDCMFDNKWVKDKEIREIFFNGRHYNVFFILLMQYALGITPALRSNIDYVFILKEPNITNRRKLYDHYAGAFPSFEVFSQAMDQCTNDYECLVVDNTVQSNNLVDQVFWYKAEPHDNFRIGCPRYWKYSQQKYNPDYMSKSTPTTVNMSDTKGKKNYIIKQIRK